MSTDNDHGITGELREWAKKLTHWWYDPVKDEYTYTTGTMPPSIDAIRLDSNIIDIADRIDAEYKQAVAAAVLIAGVPMTDENMAEHGLAKLPVDADGEYIHIGDWLTNKQHNGRLLVEAIGGNTKNKMYVVYFRCDNGNLGFHYANQCRHYHAPTVEDVLREFGRAWVEWEDGSPYDPIAKFAAKLRLAGDAE